MLLLGYQQIIPTNTAGAGAGAATIMIDPPLVAILQKNNFIATTRSSINEVP